MANVCMYGMVVKGKEKDIATFVEYMKGYHDKELCGVYKDEVFYMYYNNKHIVNGGCKHSIYISMLQEDGSYYYRLTDEDKKEFTTLEELSKQLNLKFDIEGNTDIAGEREKVIIEKGELKLYE